MFNIFLLKDWWSWSIINCVTSKIGFPNLSFFQSVDLFFLPFFFYFFIHFETWIMLNSGPFCMSCHNFVTWVAIMFHIFTFYCRHTLHKFISRTFLQNFLNLMYKFWFLILEKCCFLIILCMYVPLPLRFCF